ncbi:hypothetical protein [uncultured Clostridium sp.]|uniref:hypothetical protein n=1 Tax=uncultured Clostridium sp. TaxID=59620 RepID=UPI003217AF82
MPITLIMSGLILVGCGNKTYQATVSEVKFWGESEWDQSLNDATFTDVDVDVKFKSLKGKTQVDIDLNFVAGLPLKYDFGKMDPSFVWKGTSERVEEEHLDYSTIEITNGSGNITTDNEVNIHIKAEFENKLSEEDIKSIYHMAIRADDIGGESTPITFSISEVK